jgi:hypothetical protein
MFGAGAVLGEGAAPNGKERSNFRKRKRSKEVNENVRNKTKIKIGKVTEMLP